MGLPQVLIGNDTIAHDLDGIGIAGFDDGSHFIQFMLGMGLDSRCVAMNDNNLGVWSYMETPSVLLSRDEYSVINSNAQFSFSPVTLTVPSNAPRLKLLSPVAHDEVRIKQIFACAEKEPFSWQVILTLENLGELRCDEKGWTLNGEKADFRIDLEVTVRDHIQPHLDPMKPEGFLANTRPELPYVLCRGQYSPDPKKSERCLLYARGREHLVFIREAWLSPEEITRIGKIGNVAVGECDAMYSGDPTLAWYEQEREFFLYHKNKLLVHVSEQGVRINRFPIRKHIYPLSELKGIHAYLSNGWVECGIKLMIKERELLLVRNFEWAASVDPTYDGLNLMADTFWAVSLGMSLSKLIGCPYVADKDLQ